MGLTDDQESQGVMVAFLPTTTDWCQIELPHMTLVYAGLKSDMKITDFNELAKDAAALASLQGPFWLQVAAKEIFGDGSVDNPQVAAFRLKPTTELWAMRRQVEKWNKSEFPFNPHVTIGPANMSSPLDPVPRAIGFDRVIACYGDESLTFWMKRGSSSDY